jgi:hypothetical protein
MLLPACRVLIVKDEAVAGSDIDPEKHPSRSARGKFSFLPSFKSLLAKIPEHPGLDLLFHLYIKVTVNPSTISTVIRFTYYCVVGSMVTINTTSDPLLVKPYNPHVSKRRESTYYQ